MSARSASPPGWPGAEWRKPTVVYEDHGISSGMQLGINRAEAEGRPVERRRILGAANAKGAAEMPPLPK